jgi:hypothetical protein
MDTQRMPRSFAQRNGLNIRLLVPWDRFTARRVCCVPILRPCFLAATTYCEDAMPLGGE